MNDHTPKTESPLRLALSRTDCAKALGCGMRLIDELIAGRRANRFPVLYVNSKPLIPVRELQDWLASQVTEGRKQ